jgi:hypothetical protein
LTQIGIFCLEKYYLATLGSIAATALKFCPAVKANTVCHRHLGYFMTIWYILSSFGTFFLFWYHAPRKIWQPCSHLAKQQESKRLPDF